ncbi:MAG: SPFH domain-containing protein [Sterolibacteriaceae bacterium]|nr:SPFH domain-containing protein [Sterolibacteriaceae bacterium]MBK9086657.1 SPFH domain-containing protein [Sterolibacteriaceae bacterium]
MSLGSFIKKQFIDILQWTEDTEGVLAWRYPMADNEIQYGGSLTVRESQVAVFVNEGKVADVFAPGMYKLTTQTLPVLTYLKNWDKLFESPFKSDVYFFSTRIQTGRKWGTPQPITVRDTDFGMVRLRAFGMYSYRVTDAKQFYTELSGTREIYTREDVEEQLRGIIMATMASSLGTSGVPFLDMAANQALMAARIKTDLAVVLERYGLGLDEFNVSSISVPEELQVALDKRIAMGMAGDLGKYTQYQVANAIPLAAQNEGGLAGVGAGLSAGMVFGQTMAQSMQAAQQASQAGQPAAAAPAPAALAVEAPEIRLEKLKGLFDKGLISRADYDTAKAEVLKKLIG